MFYFIKSFCLSCLLFLISANVIGESIEAERVTLPVNEQIKEDIGYISEQSTQQPKLRSITLNKSSKYGELSSVYIVHNHHGELAARIQPQNISNVNTTYKVELEISQHFASHTFYEISYLNPETNVLSVIKISTK